MQKNLARFWSRGQEFGGLRLAGNISANGGFCDSGARRAGAAQGVEWREKQQNRLTSTSNGANVRGEDKPRQRAAEDASRRILADVAAQLQAFLNQKE